MNKEREQELVKRINRGVDKIRERSKVRFPESGEECRCTVNDLVVVDPKSAQDMIDAMKEFGL